MVIKKLTTYLCVFLLGMSCICLSACSETEDVQEEQNTVNTQEEINTEIDGEEYFSEEVIEDTDILGEEVQESGVVDEVEIIEDTGE